MNKVIGTAVVFHSRCKETCFRIRNYFMKTTYLLDSFRKDPTKWRRNDAKTSREPAELNRK